MGYYIVTFLAVAVFPVALGGYGAHLAAIAMEQEKKRTRLALVWLLASLGIVAAAGQQYFTFRSDKEHEREQRELTTRLDTTKDKLDTSLLSEGHMRGQLDSIGLMVNHLAGTGAFCSTKIVSVLQAMVANAKQRQSISSASSLSTLELRGRIDLLADDLRRIDGLYENELEGMEANHSGLYAHDDPGTVAQRQQFESLIRQQEQHVKDKLNEYCSSIHIEAVSLAEQMARREGLVGPPQPQPACLVSGKLPSSVGVPFGEITKVADYLQDIERRLPSN